MTTITAPVASARRLRAARVLEIPDVAALVGLTVLVAALAAVTWATWGDIGSDTGYDLVAGARLSHGQLPYVDYTYYYGPLAPAVVAVADLLFGVGIGAAVALGIVISAGIVGATYALARALTGPVGAFAAASLTAAVAFAPNNLSFVLPYTESTTLAVLLTLLTLVSLERLFRGARLRAAAAAGVCAGLVALTRPEFEVAVLLAFAVALVLRHRAGVLHRREVLAVAIPAIGIPACTYAVFAALTSVHRLLFSNLYPLHELHAGGSKIVRTQAPLTIGSVVSLGEKLVLYAIGIGALLLAARALQSRLRRIALIALVVVGAGFLGALVARPDSIRHWLEFAFGWIPAGVLVAAVWLGRRAFRERKISAARDVALLSMVVLAVLGLKTYAAFYFFAPNPQYAMFAAPFAAIFLARLHLVELVRSRRAFVLGSAWLLLLVTAGTALAMHDGAAKSGRVSGPGGAMAAVPAQAAVYQSAVSWIQRETSPGDPILLAPQLTSLYILSGRADPLKQIQLLPIALPRVQDERAAIVALERARVHLAIIDRHAFPEYGHTVFGGSFDRLLARWVHRNFDRVATLGGPHAGRTLDVWVRSAS